MLIAITLLASPAVGQVAGAAPGRNCVLDEDALMAKSSVAAAIAGRFRTVREAAQRSYDADERALEADERAFAGQPGTGDAATRRRAGGSIWPRAATRFASRGSRSTAISPTWTRN